MKKIILLSFILSALISCVEPPVPTVSSLLYSTEKINCNSTEGYFESLLLKLGANPQLVKVDLIKLNNPLSFAHGKSIVISSALLELCDEESELAFIIAHELGHIMRPSSGNTPIEKELLADQFALLALSEANFDTRVIPSFLPKIQKKDRTFSHPGTEQRVSALFPLIKSPLYQAPPSTYFNKLKKCVATY